MIQLRRIEKLGLAMRFRKIDSVFSKNEATQVSYKKRIGKSLSSSEAVDRSR